MKAENQNPLLVVLGTRPEAIKLAPVILELKRRNLPTLVIDSGQQKSLTKNYLEEFSIEADFFLNATAKGFMLEEVYSEILQSSASLFAELNPRAILVQGDTTTVCAAAHSGFLKQIPVVHVEAGLRTHDKYSPFPEEMNRVMVSRFASLHFAPTAGAVSNLLSEGINGESIVLVGNTGIDSLKQALSLPMASHPYSEKTVFITIHRRENHERNLAKCIEAVMSLSKTFPRIIFVFQVHPNPAVSSQIRASLTGISNVKLVDPMPYLDTVSLLRSSVLLMTDSGGLQEEATALGLPMLVLRESTERPEILHQANNFIANQNFDNIVEVAEMQLKSSDLSFLRNEIANPVFGSGNSSVLIADVLEKRFGGDL